MDDMLLMFVHPAGQRNDEKGNGSNNVRMAAGYHAHFLNDFNRFEFLHGTPYVPLSHPYVERLIGTIRREYLDPTLFWTTADLEEKLQSFQDYFNGHRVHSGVEGRQPEPNASRATLDFASYRWQRHCRGLYQTPIAA